MLVIVVMGSALGFLSNAIGPRGIPLITPPKKAAKAEEFMPLNKAHELWSSGGALFLDARNPEDFEVGHIASAISLPYERFGEYFPKVAPLLAPENPLVVYCDGTECELSHHLTDQMRSLGFTDIHMLFNGWTAWSKAGYPTETGAAK